MWTEPSSNAEVPGVDMALSFQEAEGCHMIWWVQCVSKYSGLLCCRRCLTYAASRKFVDSVQQTFQSNVGGAGT